jgi:hypothetical protein
MASNIKATPQKEEVPEKEGPETAPGNALLDLSEDRGGERRGRGGARGARRRG